MERKIVQDQETRKVAYIEAAPAPQAPAAGVALPAIPK